jgi:ubiquinone biosynthesis protein
MLFRKAVFTLEGVFYDLDPSFDMDAAIMQYIKALMTGELPMRFGNLFFPLADRSENYPSLISNVELQSLMVHLYAEAVKSSYKPFAGYLTAWNRIFDATLQ